MLSWSFGVYIRGENPKLNKMWPVKIMKGIGSVLSSLSLNSCQRLPLLSNPSGRIVKCDSWDESYYNHYFFAVLFIMIWWSSSTDFLEFHCATQGDAVLTSDSCVCKAPTWKLQWTPSFFLFDVVSPWNFSQERVLTYELILELI